MIFLILMNFIHKLMKFFNKPKSVSFIFGASFLICSIRAQTLLLDLESKIPDAERKNIAFFSLLGGSSHYTWVLSIGEELGQRGHNFYFLSTDEDARFGEPFTHVKTVPIGPGVEVKSMDTEILEVPGATVFKYMKPILESMVCGNFARDFTFAKKFLAENKIDLAVCDHMVEACVEAAIALKIPFVITATADYTTETAAPYINNNALTMKNPTTENESIVTRFNNKFIMPVEAMIHFLPTMRRLVSIKKSLGINAKLENPYNKWKDSLKLVNNLHGFTAPRPGSPLVEMVGPIIPRKYQPLTQDLQDFLDIRKKVAYIAFGQASIPSLKSSTLILTAIVDAIERGALDGFIWATVHATSDRFPREITTSSGKVYSTNDIFNHVYPHMLMEKWTPQTAILLHPSTAVFVSHGGLGSWYESMYAGTRMIMYPYFGDQPLNANTAEASGLGAILKIDDTPEQAAELVCKITNSEEIGDNVKRYQALVHIHSDYGILRGANLIEEVAYTHKDGRLPHRESADKRMSYIKSHNIDIWLLFTLAMSCLIGLLGLVSVKTLAIVGTRLNKPLKMKQI